MVQDSNQIHYIKSQEKINNDSGLRHTDHLADPRPECSTTLTHHAQRQAQRRGIGQRTLDLVLLHHDRSRKLPGKCRAIWISRKGRERLSRGGYSPSEIDRAAGIRIIIDLHDDVAVTVEHSLRRRAWA